MRVREMLLIINDSLPLVVSVGGLVLQEQESAAVPPSQKPPKMPRFASIMIRAVEAW